MKAFLSAASRINSSLEHTSAGEIIALSSWQSLFKWENASVSHAAIALKHSFLPNFLRKHIWSNRFSLIAYWVVQTIGCKEILDFFYKYANLG
jgi:uncharacterized membrane protein